jgi:hypothetical protein
MGLQHIILSREDEYVIYMVKEKRFTNRYQEIFRKIKKNRAKDR